MEAYKALKANEIKLNDLRDSLKLKNSDMISGRVDQMKQNISSLENEKAQLLLRVLNLDSDVAASKAKGENVKYVVLKTNDLQYNLKDYANAIKNKLDGGAVFIGNVANGKYSFVCALGNKATEKGLDAGSLVKEAASLCEGKGGGKKDLAQSGGVDNGQIDSILATIEAKIK